VDFVSSITLQFRDLFSQGMAQARSSVTQLQSSLNDINPAGLAGLSASALAIPAPEIGQPLIPTPDTPSIALSTPEIGQPIIPTPDSPSISITTPEIGRPVIPTPDSPSISIPTPEIDRPVIPTPDSPSISITTPEIGRPVIPTPDVPPIAIPTPDIPQPTIPAPDVPSIVIPTPQFSGMDELEEMLGGSVAHLGSMSDALDGIGKGFDDITPKVGMFDKGLAQIKSGLDKIEQNSSLNMVATQLSVMANMTAPLRNSLANMMEQPSKLAGSFESSMKNIQAITGNTNEEMAALNQQLLEIGKNAVAGPQGVVDAMNDIAGGVDNAESHLGILNGAILLAEAGQADLGVAANGLVSIMNAYSLASGDAASATENAVTVSDVLTQTVGQGVGSMEAFIGAFSQVSGLSASVGVGFDEVGAALAFITTQGPAASEAATQLKAAETALLNPNETLSKALQSINIESGSAMLAQYGLVESLRIVKQSVGGSQDSMAKALGSTMALNGATALLGSGYTDFAAKFGAALESGVTAEAAAAQNQSYESKLARMEAATQVLQMQIGDNINAIKGRFVDMGAGFLTNVVSPIMSSPIGEVFQGIAAGSGIVLQGILSFGSGALTTAAQFSVLAANIKNAGGYIEMFKGVMSLAGAPFKAVGGMVKGFITNLFSIGAASATAAGGTTAMGVASGASAAPIGTAAVATGGLGAALHGLLWPILAIVAAVALVAGGAYLLIKHWDSVAAFFANLWNKITGFFSSALNWIRNKLAGVSDWVLGAVAVFMPFIGIPALIIKHWDSIAAFFVSLWNTITGAFSAAWEWIKNSFTAAPTWISAFFQSLWASVTAAFAPVAEWFGGVWNSITTAFATAWNNAASFFTGLWNGMVNVVAGVANWFLNAWNTVVIGFTNIWNNAQLFFVNLWNGITGMVASVANWFAGIWGTATSPFAEAFIWIGDLFASIWDGIKGVVIGFVEWLSPVVEAILAPFHAIGNVIGGIVGTVGGWFGKAADAGNEAVRNMRTDLAKDTAPRTVKTAAVPESKAAIAAPDTSAAVVAAPDFANTEAVVAAPAQHIAPQAAAATASSNGNVLAMEHIEAAQRKGVSAADISYTAASAFESAGAYVPPAAAIETSPAIDWQQTAMAAASNPFLEWQQTAMTAASNPFFESLPITGTAPTVDVPDIDSEARTHFAEAMPPQRQTVIANAEREGAADETPRQNIFNIANLNLNADELRTLLDLVRQLELAVAEPEEATV
jgi:TP901 family phage tail tape measure protein